MAENLVKDDPENELTHSESHASAILRILERERVGSKDVREEKEWPKDGDR